jgi:DNA repair exonuclease SbcCD ATPase subunit
MGGSVRKQAEELAKTAASQVSEIGSKLGASESGGAIGGETEITEAKPAGKSPENISKEELLDVLQKMNKKVKSLTVIRTQLSDRVKAAELDNERLMNLVKEEILSGEVEIEDGKDPVEQLQRAWHQVDERNSLALQGLQAEYKAIALQFKEEIEKVKRASEAESQAQIDKIKEGLAAETLASGNEAWEAMREELMKRHQEESQMLRQELHQQYEHQLSHKDEEFRIKLAEELKIACKESEERMKQMTPTSNIDVDALKAQHAEEITQVKHAAASQLQTLKKKIAAARAAEIEKIKKETAAAKEAEMNTRIAELIKQHEEEINMLRNDIPGASSDSPTVEELERLNAELKTAHMEELESVKLRIVQSLGETQTQNLDDIRQQRENELRTVRAEMEALSNAQLQQLQIDAEKETQEKLKKYQKEYQNEIERLTLESSNKFSQLENENNLLSEKFNEIQTALMEKQQEIEELMGKNKLEIESVSAKESDKWNSELAALREQLRREYEEASHESLLTSESKAEESRNEIILQHKSEIEILKESFKRETLSLKELMVEEFEKKEQMLKAEMEDAVARTRLEELEKANIERSALDEDHNIKLKEVKEAYESKIHQAIREREASLQESLDRLRAEHVEELDAVRLVEKTIKDDLELANLKSSSLNDVIVQNKVLMQELEQKHTEEIQNVKTGLLKDHMFEVENLKKDFNERMERALSLERQKADSIQENMKLEFEREKEIIEENLDCQKKKLIDEIEATGTERLENIRASLQEQIDDLQSRETELKDYIEISDKREKSLLDELNDMKAKVIEAEEDRKLLAEAAKSGESSSKMLEESLAAQRNSFDTTMSTVKEQFLKEKQHLQEQLEAYTEFRRSKESEILTLTQKVVSLENAKNKSEEQLETVKKEFALKSEQASQELSVLEQNHLRELNALNEKLREVEETKAFEMEKAVLLAKEREEITLLLNTTKETLQNRCEELATELENLNATHNTELEAAREQIKALNESLEELNSHAINREAAESKLSSKLQDSQRRCSDLEMEVTSLRKASEESAASKADQMLRLNEALQDSVSNLERLKVEFEFDKKTLQNQYEQDFQSIRSHAQDLEEKLKLSADSNHEAVERQKVLEEESKVLRTNLSLLQQQYDLDLTTARVQKKELEDQANTLVEKLRLAETRQKALEDEVEIMKTKTDESIGELRPQLESLQKENAVLVEKLTELQTTCLKDKSTISNLSQQVEILRQQLSECENELNSKIQNLVLEKQSAGQSVSEEAEKFKNTIESLKAEHESALIHQQNTFARTLGDVDAQLSDAVNAVETRRIADLESLRQEHADKLSVAQESVSSLRKEIDVLQQNLDNVQATLGEERNIFSQSLKDKEIEMAKLLADKEVEFANSLQNAETERQEGLECIRADYESKVATVKEAETSLLQEIEILRHTIEELKGNHEAELNERQSFIDQTIADSQQLHADSLKDAETRKEQDLAAMKQEYEEKFRDLKEKQAKAVEMVKKLKAAMNSKLQGIEKEREKERTLFDEARVKLESQLKADHDALVQSLNHDHTLATREWEAKLEEKKSELEENLFNENKVWEERLAKMQEDVNVKISSLETELEISKKNLEDITALSEEEMQHKVNTKVTLICEEYEGKINNITTSHAEEIESQREFFTLQIQNLKDEHHNTMLKVITDKDSESAAIKQDLECRLQDVSLKFAEEKRAMQERLAAHVDELKRRFNEKMNEMDIKHGEKVKNLNEELISMKERYETSVSQLNEKIDSFDTLEKKHEVLQTKFSSDVVVKEALQKKIEELQKQLADSVSLNSAINEKMIKIQKNHEIQMASVEDQLKQTLQDRDVKKNKIEELIGKIDALGANLNVTLDDKSRLESALQIAEKKAGKLEMAETELNALREQINKLKLEQTKSNSLLEKLQAEKEANQRNHGQRTALVGMLEEQLADVNEKNSELNAKLEASKYDLSSREEELRLLQEQLDNALKSAVDAQTARKQLNDSLTTAQKGSEAKKSKVIESLQKEVQSLQQQMAKKSAAAQKLIQQREAECIELRKSTKALQQEVDKGSLSDRRIFELAAQQSNRETLAVSEIEVRDKLVDKLTEKLEVQDVDLAKAEYNMKQYENQVEQLCRIRRREDVNLDYLKSIVVQYLSKPPGSSEREALLPVLATLLQFDANDYKTIEDGKNRISWWGGISPILITPPTTNAAVPEAAPLLSAEISVSRTSSTDAALNNGKSRTSSLEF